MTTDAMRTETFRPSIWDSSDRNALFAFGTNILVNMLVLTGLLRFVLKMPESPVFGRILPALGLMMCLSTMYYAFSLIGWRSGRVAATSARCRPASASRICSSSPS